MLDKEELANYLNVSERTIDRMVEYGMPRYKTSSDRGLVRFDIEEVKEWMRNNAQKNNK